MRGMKRASQLLYGEAFRWDGIDVSGRLDPMIFEEALALNGLAPTGDGHRTFHDAYLFELARELEQISDGGRALPGVRELVVHLHARREAKGDVIQGLVTGNYAKAAPMKLRACGFDTSWFEITAFGDEGRTRSDLVALALRKCAEHTGRAPDPSNVVVIGDTPRDIECAHAHGCVAFAVATGSYSLAELRAAGADVVVGNLSDPAPLLELIGGA